LPSEIALAQDFGVSVGTLRRAMGELTAGGMLARRRKTGTVVTGRTPDHSLRFVYNYFRLHSRQGALQTSVVRILNHTVRPATIEEVDRLAIEDTCEVHAIHRLRLVDGRPVMHERIIIPAHFVPEFPSDPADIPDRIYFMLWSEYGLKISAIREQLEALLADDMDRELLDLQDPSAILVLDEIAYDERARPLLLNLHRASTRDDVYINEIQ
jgi:GntR family transcriptional regulator